MTKKPDWRRKYIETLTQQSKNQALVRCNCGDLNCLMEVGWWEDIPNLWLSFTLKPLSLWQRIKAIWGIITRDYVWLREIILDADTCDWLGNLLIERAGKIRKLMETRTNKPDSQYYSTFSYSPGNVGKEDKEIWQRL